MPWNHVMFSPDCSSRVAWLVCQNSCPKSIVGSVESMCETERRSRLWPGMNYTSSQQLKRLSPELDVWGNPQVALFLASDVWEFSQTSETTQNCFLNYASDVWPYSQTSETGFIWKTKFGLRRLRHWVRRLTPWYVVFLSFNCRFNSEIFDDSFVIRTRLFLRCFETFSK